jgi:hypothetical protein
MFMPILVEAAKLKLKRGLSSDVHYVVQGQTRSWHSDGPRQSAAA